MEKILPLGKLSEYESKLVKAAVPELQDNITKVRMLIGLFRRLYY